MPIKFITIIIAIVKISTNPGTNLIIIAKINTTKEAIINAGGKSPVPVALFAEKNIPKQIIHHNAKSIIFENNPPVTSLQYINKTWSPCVKLYELPVNNW